MNDYLKYAAGAALFVLWAVLVIYLKLDPSDLIETIKLGVYAILGFVGVTKLQAAPTPPANAAAASKDIQTVSPPTVPLQ